MATASAAVSTATCLPLVTRTSRREPQEAPPSREASLCPFPTRPRRWTWPRRLPSPRSPSTPHLLQLLICQRPTTNHAKRSMPKRLGQARSPPLHCSFNQFVKAADSQVTSIRDCDLAQVESFTSQICFCLFWLAVAHRHHRHAPHYIPLVFHKASPARLISRCFTCKQNYYEVTGLGSGEHLSLRVVVGDACLWAKGSEEEMSH